MAKNKNSTNHNILNNNFYIFVLIILLVIILFILSSCINKSSFTVDINKIIIDKPEGFQTNEGLPTYNEKEIQSIVSNIINVNYSTPPNEYKGVWNINSDEFIITDPIDNFTELAFNIKKYETTDDGGEAISENILLILENTSGNRLVPSTNINNFLKYSITDVLKNSLFKKIETYRSTNNIEGNIELYLSGKGTSNSETINYNKNKYPIRIINAQNMLLTRQKINGKYEYKLTIDKKSVDNTYIYKNDILQIYDESVPKEDLILNKTLFFFKVDNVSFDKNNNFIITINDINTINKLDNDYNNNKMKIITEINYNNKLICKIIGNQYENSIITDNAQLLNSNKNESIQYKLVFNLLDNRRIDKNGNPENDKKLNKKIKDFYKIDDTIEIISKNVNSLEANNIFIIKETYFDPSNYSTTLYLNTNNKDVKEINKDDKDDKDSKSVKEEFLVTKFDLNNIIKDFYESQTQYNIDYLATKNKINNYKTIIDNIKKQVDLT
jgi:hypothetical protein